MSRTSKYLICFLGTSLALLSGCASKPTLWNLNGQTKQDLDARHYFCQDFAAKNTVVSPSAPGNKGYGIGAGNPYMALGSLLQLSGSAYGNSMLYESCMNEGGFYKRK
jgi:hypothetical protein